MSSKDRERKRKRLRSSLRWRKNDKPHLIRAAPSLEVIALHTAAPAIEAAGSLQRAVELGFLSCSPAAMQALADRVPVSRGGNLLGDDVDAEWLRIVEQNVGARNVNIEAMRRLALSLQPKSLQ